jgi:hypothetical protein
MKDEDFGKCTVPPSNRAEWEHAPFNSLALLVFLRFTRSGHRTRVICGCGPQLRARRQAEKAAQHFDSRQVPSGLCCRRPMQGICISHCEPRLRFIPTSTWVERPRADEWANTVRGFHSCRSPASFMGSNEAVSHRRRYQFKHRNEASARLCR